MTTHLVWFRRDLRLHDNLALAAACRNSDANVLALFIATPCQWRQHEMAPRQAWFIYQHVCQLGDALAQKGIALSVLETDDFSTCTAVVKQFCQENRVETLFYNYQYELNERRRDAEMEKALGDDVACQGFDDSVILAPGSVITGDNKMYKVFTPFSKAFLRRLRDDIPECLHAPSARHCGAIAPPRGKAFNYPQQDVDAALFPVGEDAALARLRQFCREGAGTYSDLRNVPRVSGTSLLSPYLTIGVLSPRQCLHRLLAEYPDALEGGDGAVWLNELIWREFYRHLITYSPSLCCHRPFVKWTDNVKWQKNDSRLHAWQQGNTGFPIVDAAMRQLNATGWMHNRLSHDSCKLFGKGFAYRLA